MKCLMCLLILLIALNKSCYSRKPNKKKPIANSSETQQYTETQQLSPTKSTLNSSALEALRRQKMERFLKKMNISSIQSAEDLQLYGAPAFCKWNVYTKCFEEQFTRCDDCVILLKTVLVICYLILGLFILFGNLFVLFQTWVDTNLKPTKVDISRSSLCISDISTAMFIFSKILPNIYWTLNNNGFQLVLKVQRSEDSATSKGLSTIFIFFYLLSLYQLNKICIHKFFSVARPGKKLRRTHVLYILAGVWIFAFMISTFPMWRALDLNVAYNQVLFLHFLSLQSIKDNSLFVIIIFVYLPYITMLCANCSTYLMIRKQFLQSPKSLRSQFVSKKLKDLKRNKTITYMVIGFVMTTVPLLIFGIAVAGNGIPKESISVPYTILFFIFNCRSCVNIGVFYYLEQTRESNKYKRKRAAKDNKRESKTQVGRRKDSIHRTLRKKARIFMCTKA